MQIQMAYGILLSPSEVEMVMNDIADSDNDTLFEDELARINNNSDLLVSLQDSYDAPEASKLIHTGFEEDRQNNYETPPEQFVLGFNVRDFPDKWFVMEPRFKKAASWHAWVS